MEINLSWIWGVQVGYEFVGQAVQQTSEESGKKKDLLA